MAQSLRGGGSGRSRPASTMRCRSAARSGNRSTTWSRHRRTVSTSATSALRPLAVRHRVRTAGDEHAPAVPVQLAVKLLRQVLCPLLPGRQQVLVNPVFDLTPDTGRLQMGAKRHVKDQSAPFLPTFIAYPDLHVSRIIASRSRIRSRLFFHRADTRRVPKSVNGIV